ncbi:MAG: glycosyltransferase family 2 protein, partial [Candidatus Omnitrophota bacterium]
SQDNSVTMVRNDFPDTLLIGNQENLGFARGNNQAFAKSRGRYFLLLNPDTRVLSGSLEKMVEFLDGHPDAGAVAPKYLNPDGTFQRYYYRFPNSLIFPISQTLPGVLISRKIMRKFLKNYYYLKDGDRFNAVCAIDQPAASALIVRSALFKGEDLFDERFAIFLNDVDLCRRIYKKGYRIYFLPDAEIIHYFGKGAGESATAIEIKDREFYIDWLRYIRKYHSFCAYVYAKFSLLILLAFFGIRDILGLSTLNKDKKTVLRNLQRRLVIILEKSSFDGRGSSLIRSYAHTKNFS